MRIALAQINSTVGDLEGNAEKILSFVKKAESRGADIVVFPELATTGYPPEDLLLKPSFVAENLKALRGIARGVRAPAVIIGFVDKKGKSLFNAAALVRKGKIQAAAYKILLPNYGVFDEKRYFRPGTDPFVFTVKKADTAKSDFTVLKAGVNICEDVWYEEGPTRVQAKSGAKIIFTLNASPYHAGKIKEREAVVRRQAKKNNVWICYVNLVGGQDELVFDGQSMIVDSGGKVVARAKAFQEDLLVADIDLKNSTFKIPNSKPIPSKFQIPNRPLPFVEEIYQALVLGLRDYVWKNGFQKVVIGLSGGIDSSLVAVLAVDALGKENVIGVRLPSPYSSTHSKEDAAALAKNLGIRLLTIPISRIYRSYLTTLNPPFRLLKPGFKQDVAEENIQARIRGNILMALSNKFGWLVLSTGNKSETSVGYATLYGDMAGGFAPIKDVYKTMIYRLANYRNSLCAHCLKKTAGAFFFNIAKKNRRCSFFQKEDMIPQRILKKPPSAELRPGQKDTDTLPPYEILDPILKAYIEEDKSANEIIALGFPRKTVLRVLSMVDKNEYKRRQAPPGIKITPKAFGKDRRMPITNRYAIGNSNSNF